MLELVEVKTIAEVERIVNGSGLWDGTGPVEFSDDGQTWTEAWVPSRLTIENDEAAHILGAHPQFARVSVYRKEVRIPTTVTIRWVEQFPAASEEWSEKWTRSPMRHFGRTVRMVAYRQTFRELLGDVRIEDEADDRAAPHDVVPETAPRDWSAEIQAAAKDVELDAIEKEGRKLRIFTPDAVGTALHVALRTRRRDLADAVPVRTPAVDLTAEELALHNAFFGDDARAVPQDHLPGNRAARRAAARKKGGRR